MFGFNVFRTLESGFTKGNGFENLWHIALKTERKLSKSNKINISPVILPIPGIIGATYVCMYLNATK